ncbi:MAG: extracellular solute-binding protein [Acidobacteriaceae bacterium]
MMKPRGLSTFLSVLFSIVLLAGCAPKATPTAEPTTAAQPTSAVQPTTAAKPTQAVEPTAPAEAGVLRAWVNLGDDPAQVQALFNEYAAVGGKKVEVNMPVPYDKIFAGLAGDNPPDLLILPEQFSTAYLVSEGLILPLDDLMAAANFDMADLNPELLKECNYGVYFCMPWGTDTHILLYNKDMFEDAGLDPEKPPETLEQLVEFADKLTKVDADGNLTQVGFIPDFAYSHIDSYMAVFGASFYSADGTKITLNTPEMNAILKWEQEFYTKYGADKVLKFTSGAGAFNSPDMGFYTGKIAMLIDAEMIPGPNYIAKFKPELNFGVAAVPYPQDNPAGKDGVQLGGTVIVIPKGAPDPAESAKLAAWLLSPEMQVKEFTQNWNIPSSLSATRDPAFESLGPDFKIFMDLAVGPTAKIFYYGPLAGAIVQEMSVIEEQAVHNGADPAPLLAESEAKLQAMLDAMLSGGG